MNFENLKSITIGVRYQINNSIEDNLGKITDEILFTKNTPFPPEFFTEARSGADLKLLSAVNKETYLLLKNTDTIFNNIIVNNEIDLDKEFDKFNQYIYKAVLTKYKIKRLIRYGIIYNFCIDNKNVISSIQKYYLKDMIDNVNQFDLIFSKKFPTIENIVKKTKDDYTNIIYKISKKPDEEKLYVSIDYQEVYIPKVSRIELKPINEFFNRSKQKIKSNVFKWIDEISNAKVKK